jgi:glycosyltransferase involved in cell wall biosynthesis
MTGSHERTGSQRDADKAALHADMSCLDTPSPELSVVMPTYRQPHCLEPVLESLARQALAPERFEVIVVEDPSDVSYELVAKRAEELGFRFEQLPAHQGRSAARNRALGLARGEAVLLLDSDCYAAPDLLERHCRFHRDSRGSRILLGARLETPLAVAGRLMRGEPVPASESQASCYDLRFHAGVPVEVIRTAMETPWLYTFTNISVPRTLLAKVGSFDEEFGTRWGLEDIELFYRIYVELGRPPDAFVYDHTVIAYHLPHYRDGRRESAEFDVNDSLFKLKHPHFETELGVADPHVTGFRVRHYRERVAELIAAGMGRVDQVTWRLLEETLAGHEPRRVLYAGLGMAQLPLPAGTVTVDHGAAVSSQNHHLLIVDTTFPDRAFDVVVNVDLWRLLTWNDLCRHITEALRIAGELLLVHTGQRPDAVARASPDLLVTDDDLNYLVHALSPHAMVAVGRQSGGFRLIRIWAAGAGDV